MKVAAAAESRELQPRKVDAGTLCAAAELKLISAPQRVLADRNEATRRGRQTMSKGNVTTNHGSIRRWAEERGGTPATVKRTAGDHEPGILRLDFEPRDESLEPIEWDEFFEKFDKEDLAFLHQDRTESGELSRFHKFINRSSSH